jgi:hypothetical protein
MRRVARRPRGQFNVRNRHVAVLGGKAMTCNLAAFHSALVAWLLVGTEAVAQELPASLRQCVSEQDSARRLACFDRETARLVQQQDSRLPVAVPASALALASESKPRSDEENFGFRGKLAREESDRKAAENPGLEQLIAIVVQLRTRPYGEFVVTLSNGQEWVQKELDKSVHVKVGDQITIKPGTLGSYFLNGAKGAATRVTRVK